MGGYGGGSARSPDSPPFACSAGVGVVWEVSDPVWVSLDERSRSSISSSFMVDVDLMIYSRRLV